MYHLVKYLNWNWNTFLVQLVIDSGSVKKKVDRWIDDDAKGCKVGNQVDINTWSNCLMDGEKVVVVLTDRLLYQFSFPWLSLNPHMQARASSPRTRHTCIQSSHLWHPSNRNTLSTLNRQHGH
jgi:hypothetical protein